MILLKLFKHLLILGVIFSISFPSFSQTTYYWSPASSSNTSWSHLANWKTGGYGGAPATSLPGLTDNVHIGGNNNSYLTILDANDTITNLIYDSTFAIFIYSPTHKVLRVTGNITLNNTSNTGGGTATIMLAGSSTQHIYGSSVSGESKLPDFKINSSSVVACSGYITLGGSSKLTYTSGTINANNSDFIFYYNDTISGKLHLKNAEFQGTGGMYIVTDTLFVDSTLTTSGTLWFDFGSGNITLSGNLNILNTGGFFDDGTNLGTLILSGSKNQTITGNSPIGQGMLPPITINKTGGTLSLAGTITVYGSWINNYSTTQILYGTSEVGFGLPNKTIHLGGTYRTPFYKLTFNEPSNVTCAVDIDSAAIVKDTFKIAGVHNALFTGHSLALYKDLVNISTGTSLGGTTEIIFKGSNNQHLTSTAALGVSLLPSIRIQKTAGTLYLNGIISTDGNWTNNYSTSNISYGIASLYFWLGNGTCNAGGSYSTPIHKLIIGANQNSTLNLTADSAFIVKDTLLLQASGGHYNIISNYSLNIEGEVVNNNSGYSSTTQFTSLFNFRGSNNQTLKGSALLIQKLAMNKSGGSLTLYQPLTINNNLTLNNGDIVTSSTSLLTLNSGSTLTGANDNSFISGPVNKIGMGTTAFVFPVGKTGGYYNPIEVTASSSISDAFTAEYFNAANDTTTKDTSLTYVSHCGYWHLNHTAGTNTVKVALDWNTHTCDIKTLTTLRLSHLVSGTWTKVSATTSGSTSSGKIISNSNQSSFGTFAIGKHSPTPTANAGTNASICKGSSVPLNASASGGFGTYTYSWSLPTGLSSAIVYNPTASPTVTTTYTVTVNDNDNAPPASNSVIVKVNSLPVANAGGNKPVCAGSGIQIGSSPSSGTLPYSYAWSPSATLNSTTIQQPTATPTVATTYHVIVTDSNGCIGKDSAIVSIQPKATAYIGASTATICANGTFTFTADSASHYDSLKWTSTGTGTFSNTHTLHPTYTPSTADGTTGSVTLTLKSYGHTPCTYITSSMTLTLILPPAVEAGSDISICSNTLIDTLSSATASHYTTLRWKTTGTGTFSDTTIIHPRYTWTSSDSAAGSVFLILKATGNTPCASITDSLRLTIVPKARVYAGKNDTLCSGALFDSMGHSTASHYMALHWHTSGTGTFNDTTALHPLYFFSAADLTAGTVTLTLTATGNTPCGNATSSMTLKLIKQALAYAGGNASVCANNAFNFTLDTAINYDSLVWTTNGTGYFINNHVQHPQYVPSVSDSSVLYIKCYLKAFNNDACGNSRDSMLLTVLPSGVSGCNCKRKKIYTVDRVTNGGLVNAVTVTADTVDITVTAPNDTLPSDFTLQFPGLLRVVPDTTDTISDLMITYASTSTTGCTAGIGSSPAMLHITNTPNNSCIHIRFALAINPNTIFIKSFYTDYGYSLNQVLLRKTHAPIFTLYLSNTAVLPAGQTASTPEIKIEDVGSLTSIGSTFWGMRVGLYYFRKVKLTNIGNRVYEFNHYDSLGFTHVSVDKVPGSGNPYYVLAGLALTNTFGGITYSNGTNTLPTNALFKTLNYASGNIVSPTVRKQNYFLVRSDIWLIDSINHIANSDSLKTNAPVYYYEVYKVVNCFGTALSRLNDSLTLNWESKNDSIYGYSVADTLFPTVHDSAALTMYQNPAADIQSTSKYYDYSNQTQHLRWHIYNTDSLSTARNLKMDIYQYDNSPYTSLQSIDSLIWHIKGGDSIVFRFSNIKSLAGSTISKFPLNANQDSISGWAWNSTVSTANTYLVKGIQRHSSGSPDTFLLRAQQNYLNSTPQRLKPHWILLDFDSTKLLLNGAGKSMDATHYLFKQFAYDFIDVYASTLTAYTYDSCDCGSKYVRDWAVNVRYTSKCGNAIDAMNGLNIVSSQYVIPSAGTIIFPNRAYTCNDIQNGGFPEITGNLSVSFSGNMNFIGPALPTAIPGSAGAHPSSAPPSFGYSASTYPLECDIAMSNFTSVWDGNGKNQAIDIDIVLDRDLYMDDDPILHLAHYTSIAADSPIYHLGLYRQTIPGVADSAPLADYTQYAPYLGSFYDTTHVKTPGLNYYDVSIAANKHLTCTNGMACPHKLYRYRLTWGQLFKNTCGPYSLYYLLNNAYIKVNLRSKCGRGYFANKSGLENIKINFYHLPNYDSASHTLDTTSYGRPNRVLISSGCLPGKINLQCPGCLNQGIESRTMDVVRQTYGYVDKDDNGIWDGATPTRANSNTPNVARDRVMQGDTFSCVLNTKIHLYRNHAPYKPGGLNDCSLRSSQYYPKGDMKFKYAYWHLYFKEADSILYLNNPNVQLIGIYFKYQDNHFDTNKYSHPPYRSDTCDTFTHFYTVASQFDKVPFGTPWQTVYKYASSPYGKHYKSGHPRNTLDFFIDLSLDKWLDFQTHDSTVVKPINFIDDANIIFYAQFKQVANVAGSSAQTPPMKLEQDVNSRIYLALDKETTYKKVLMRVGSTINDTLRVPVSKDPGEVTSKYPVDTLIYQAKVPDTCGSLPARYSSCSCSGYVNSFLRNDSGAIVAGYSETCDSMQWYCTDMSGTYYQIGYAFPYVQSSFLNGNSGFVRDSGCSYLYSFDRSFYIGQMVTPSDPFPYEYRHWNHTDSIVVSHPAGFSFQRFVSLTTNANGFTNPANTTTFSNIHVTNYNKKTVIKFTPDLCGADSTRKKTNDYFPYADDGFEISGVLRFAYSCGDTNHIDTPNVSTPHPIKMITTLCDHFAQNFNGGIGTYNHYFSNGQAFGSLIPKDTVHTTGMFPFNWDSTHLQTANIITKMYNEKPNMQFEKKHPSSFYTNAYNRCIEWSIVLHNDNHDYIAKDLNGLHYSMNTNSFWLGYDSALASNLCSVKFTFLKGLSTVLKDSTVSPGVYKNYFLPVTINNDSDYINILVDAYVKSLCDTNSIHNTMLLKTGWTCTPCSAGGTCITRTQDSVNLRVSMTGAGLTVAASVNNKLLNVITDSVNTKSISTDTLKIDSCVSGISGIAKIKVVNINQGAGNIGDIENNTMVLLVPSDLIVDTSSLYLYYNNRASGSSTTPTRTHFKLTTSNAPTTTAFNDSTYIPGYTRYTLFLNNLNNVHTCACQGTTSANQNLPHQPGGTSATTPDNIDSIVFNVHANCCIIAGQNNLTIISKGRHCVNNPLIDTIVIPFKIKTKAPLFDSICAPIVGNKKIIIHCNRDPFTLHAYIGGAAKYQWEINGDTAHSTAANPYGTKYMAGGLLVHPIGSSMTFILKVFNGNSCTLSDTVLLQIDPATTNPCACGYTKILDTTTLKKKYIGQNLWFCNSLGKVFKLGNVTFIDCSILMDSGVSIIVKAHDTVTFQSMYTSLQSPVPMRIFGCDSLWKGIIVDSIGSQLNIIGKVVAGGYNVSIEDALIAVQSTLIPSKKFNAVNCANINFLNDKVGIQAIGSLHTLSRGQYYPLNVTGCNFEFINNSLYPSPLQNSGANAGDIGIELINVITDDAKFKSGSYAAPLSYTLDLGDPDAYTFNIFNTLKFGIYASRSTFTAYSSKFLNIHTDTVANVGGSGVYVTAHYRNTSFIDTSYANVNNCFALEGTDFMDVIFNHCDTAVTVEQYDTTHYSSYINGGIDFSIEGCVADSCLTGLFLNNVWLTRYAFFDSASWLSLSHFNINNFSVRDYGVYARGSFNNLPLVLDENILSCYQTSNSKSYVPTGILIYPNTGTLNSVHASFNSIINFQTGIDLYNLNKPVYTPDTLPTWIFGNDISFKFLSTSSPSLTNFIRAIGITNCYAPRVGSGKNVYHPGSFLSLGSSSWAPYAEYSNWIHYTSTSQKDSARGIYVISSQNSYLELDSVANAGVGMWFEGANLNANAVCSRVVNYSTNSALGAIFMNNCGKKGVGPFTNSNRFKTIYKSNTTASNTSTGANDTFLTGTNSTLCYTPAGGSPFGRATKYISMSSIGTNASVPLGNNILPITSIATYQPCYGTFTSIDLAGHVNDTTRASMLHDFMDGTIPDSAGSSADSAWEKYMLDRQVYKIFTNNPGLATLEYSDDSFYIVRLHILNQGNPGKFYRVDSLIAHGHYAAATVVNDSINIGYINDYYENLVNTIDIEGLESGFTSGMLSTLTGIAYMNATQYGYGVHKARTILGIRMNEPYSTMGAGKRDYIKGKTLPPPAPVSFTLYPNPASNAVNINVTEIGVIKIADIFGRVLMTKEVPEGSTIISTQYLASGAYFVTFIPQCCNKELMTKKLMISK